MDTMKMTIINNSSLSGIPGELIDEKIMNAGHLIEQKIIIVDK